MILGIDSTGELASLALLHEEKVLGAVESKDRFTAEAFVPLINELLGISGVQLESITRIAVATGPGSFTGIRSGIASAQGLAMGMGVPVQGIDVLLSHALSWFIKSKNEEHLFICPIVKANKSEHYFALYRTQASSVLEVIPPSVISSDLINCNLTTVLREGGFVSASEEVSCVDIDSLSPHERGARVVATGANFINKNEQTAGNLAVFSKLEPVYVKHVNALTLEERRKTAK